MNNSKKMTEIIEKKKELSQEKTPKYGTRKLSIGLVSCMLGFSLIIAPGSSKAAEASENETVATETNKPEENPVEEATPVANEEIKTEETKEEVVAKQADTFVEKLETIEVEEGEEIDYKEAVTNLPQDAKLDVITPVDTKETGEKTTSAKITFADGSVKEIQIKVNVKAVEATEEAEDLELSEKVEKQAVKATESPSTGVREADQPEDTTTTSDAKNAVHGYVGVQVGDDINKDLSKAGKGQFRPIEGVRVYFQWFEKEGNRVSPVYSAVSDSTGQFHMEIKSYIGEDGKLVKFDADTTSSAGSESYKFWVDASTIPAGYQLQYSTGESVEFTDRGVAGANYYLIPNKLTDFKVLLMEIPKEDLMHKQDKETPAQIFKTDPGQGAVRGKVSWDYESAGGIQWGIVATHTSPAPGVKVRASYLSDYALKQIFSAETAKMLNVSSPSKIRGAGWTYNLEKQLQDWIKEQVAKDPDKWIAETVSAVTNAEGDYKIQFNGTWGPERNGVNVAEYNRVAGKYYAGDAHKWTEEEVNRLGTVANSAEEGSFLTGALDWKEKHINSDWLFISVEGTDKLRVMTPWNNNWYTGSNNAWGIHGGWAQTAFGVSTAQAANSTRADFALAPAEIKFNITNYDTGNNTATPGDVAKTETAGLPYSNTTDSFRIVWYDAEGNVVKTENASKPSSTGGFPEATFDTKDVTETKTFTAKLYRVDSKGNNAQLLAQDSFTVEVNKNVGSLNEEVKFDNEPIDGAKYSAEGLPAGLTIDETTGVVSGKPTEAGKFKATITVKVPDDAGEISVTKTQEYIITDSPLKDGNVGKEYNTTVKPSPIDGYVFKNVTAKFIDGKAIDGLTITGDQITGKPTAKVEATQDAPNVEVTYDIYKLNEKGEEILIKKGHVDRVPLSIKEVQEVKTAEKVQPEYTGADAQVGKPTTITAPNFTDDKGQDTTKPEGTKFALGKDAPEGAKINPETGEITYTPTEADAGKDVKIPVVVTYKDGSTDEVNANVTVAALDDIIDRTGNEDKPTPKGYVRVTFEAGEGVNPLEGAKVYDVKEGTVLPADKYPTVTAKDGFENPTWSTKPGTAITKDNAKITAIATKKNEETSKKPVINDVTENDKTISGKGVAGSDIVVTRGEDVIGQTTVKDDGTWSVDVPAGETLAKDDEIVVTQTEKDKNPAEEKTTVKEKAPVAKPDAPSLKANDDGSVTVTPPTDKDVDVVQITYTDENNHQGTLVATKDKDGNWKLPDGTDPSITIDPATGVVTIPANQVKDGSEVKAVAEKDGTHSDEAKVNAKNNPVTKKEITKWVQETADGRTIELKTEDGAHPDNDGKSDIEGYEFVRTDKTEDDTTITYTNVYKLLLGSKAVGLDGKELKEATIGYNKENPEKFDGYTYLFDEGESNPSDVQGQKAYLVNRIYAKNPAVVEVANPDSLTADEQNKVKEAVKKANPDLLDNQISVNDKGEVTITRGKQTAKLDPTLTVVKQGQTDAEKNPAVAPEKTEVVNKTALTDAEKSEVEEKVKKANPNAKDVTVGNDGSVTLTYPDGSINTLTPEQTVTEKGKPQTDAEKNPAVAPEKTEVVNKTALTDAEKSEVEEKVKKANPAAKDVTVDDKGNATLTYPDGSTNTLP
ncbi:MAG: YPDG domain-containing protein, partial [Anaerococcus vaginalis]|uniref:Rib/alpha-like domain-containing protein n=1 Tax=Anaerococcus vaginalis TaxID=33037 RepID=UPI00242B8C00